MNMINEISLENFDVIFVYSIFGFYYDF